MQLKAALADIAAVCPLPSPPPLSPSPNECGAGCEEGGGKVSNAHMNGKGKMTWSSGEVYEGGWQHGLQHGRGTMRWLDRRMYVGEWSCGKPNGNGLMLYPDGRREQGQWRMGEYCREQW